MDYEKMYKAVLKTATQWFKDGCSDKEKICLECIFPELRESEDERIRKEIIDFIQWAEDRGMTRHDYHQAKRPAVWIAYLEKQKECVVDNNKTSAEEDERIRARLIEYFQGFLEGYEDCYKDGGCVKWEGLDVKSILAWLEKQKENANSFTDGIIEVRSFQRGLEEGRRLERQKEQKPAEWDDYTKTNLGRAIQIIKDARGTLHGYQTDDGIYECDKAIEALEHFLYRGLEIEKLAEWSEDIIRKAIKEVGLTQHQIDWFKTNVFPPKPEWSEEDKDKVVQYLHDRDGGMLWSKATDITRDILDMLRPSWKPSENQMEALNKAIPVCMEVAGRDEIIPLESLYEQLKKL